MKCISEKNLSEVITLIVSSASEFKSARWQEGLSGVADLYRIDSLNRLKNELPRLTPEILLLDYDLPGLDGTRGISVLKKLCPQTKIVVFNDCSSEDDEWAMFKAGARGCCTTDIQPSTLKMMIDSIRKGELWIRRTLTSRLLEQLVRHEERPVNNVNRKTLGLLDQLTEREYEIAVKVARGESNKEIACALDITERTVKAHMTKVFNKLGVTDRLKVALILRADTRQERRVVH